MSPKELELRLQLWAMWLEGDRALLRRLWYPSCTSEYRFAQWGCRLVSSQVLSPGFDVEEIAGEMDRVMAALRKHNRRWYRAVVARVMMDGPDMIRAQKLKMTELAFRRHLYAGHRWLRSRLKG